MNISSATNTALYGSYGSQLNHPPALANTAKDQHNTNINTAEDKVTISSEGLSAANQSLESYRMPSWITDFIPKLNILNGNAVEEGRQFVKYHDQLAADGVISAKDEQALQTYIKNMPATQLRKDLEIDMNKNRALYEEFGQIHKSYLDESLAEYGIAQDEWKEKIMGVEGDNQSLRNSVIQKMFNDPRAMELMDKLHIQRPD